MDTHESTTEAAGNLIRRNFATDPYIRALEAELLEAAPGRVTLRMRLRPQDINFNGTGHGGVIFGLADSAFGLASNSHGPVAAGIDAHIVYARAVREGDALTASARQVTDTPRLATYRVDVTKDDDTIIATFTGTVYITKRRHSERD